MKKLIKIRKI